MEPSSRGVGECGAKLERGPSRREVRPVPGVTLPFDSSPSPRPPGRGWSLPAWNSAFNALEQDRSGTVLFQSQ